MAIAAVSALLAPVFTGAAGAHAQRGLSVAGPAHPTVSGTIPFAARGVDAGVRQIVFTIDGHRRWITVRRPFRFRSTGLLNTQALRNGSHTLAVEAVYRNRHVRLARERILVRNAPRRSARASARASAHVARHQPPVPNGLLSAQGAPAAAAPGTAVVRFNRETYAYSSPLSLTQEASRYQVMVLQATDGWVVPLLHAANPGLKILVYQHPWNSKATDPGALSVCTSYASDLASHPDWFLRDAAGNLIQNRNYPGDYLMDLGNAAYRQACLANSVRLAKQYGFDGVYLDEVNATTQWDLPAGTTLPAYPTVGAWQAAMGSLLAYAANTLHSQGLLAFGNVGGTWTTPGLWDFWSAILDGSEQEAWTGSTPGLAAGVWLWPSEIADVAWSEAHGKYTILHSYSTSEAGNAYGLASMMLVAGGHTSYSTANLNYTSSESSYPEQTTAQQLGAPQGGYTRLANGVYERVFARGIVLVNPTNSTVASFSLGGGAYTGSGLINARSLAMGPTSGYLLLRVG